MVLKIAPREKTGLVFACEIGIPFRFHVSGSDAVDFSRGWEIRDGDFVRTYADGGSVLRVETVDVVTPVSSKNVVFERQVGAAIQTRSRNTTQWPCESALEKLLYLLVRRD
jgi:hypothetical protein